MVFGRVIDEKELLEQQLRLKAAERVCWALKGSHIEDHLPGEVKRCLAEWEKTLL